MYAKKWRFFLEKILCWKAHAKFWTRKLARKAFKEKLKNIWKQRKWLPRIKLVMKSLSRKLVHRTREQVVSSKNLSRIIARMYGAISMLRTVKRPSNTTHYQTLRGFKLYLMLKRSFTDILAPSFSVICGGDSPNVSWIILQHKTKHRTIQIASNFITNWWKHQFDNQASCRKLFDDGEFVLSFSTKVIPIDRRKQSFYIIQQTASVFTACPLTLTVLSVCIGSSNLLVVATAGEKCNYLRSNVEETNCVDYNELFFPIKSPNQFSVIPRGNLLQIKDGLRKS